jgi:hypothetical protein
MLYGENQPVAVLFVVSAKANDLTGVVLPPPLDHAGTVIEFPARPLSK